MSVLRISSHCNTSIGVGCYNCKGLRELYLAPVTHSQLFAPEAIPGYSGLLIRGKWFEYCAQKTMKDQGTN